MPMQNNITTGNSLSDEQVRNLKALMSFYNARLDTKIKIYTAEKLFNIQDIKKLKEKVDSKLATHNHSTVWIKIIITYKNRKVDEFGSWTSFLAADFEIWETIKSLTIDRELILELPGYELPQKHNLKLRLWGELRPDEVLKAIFNWDDKHEIEAWVANAVCKITYVNESFANDIINLISDRHNSLDDQQNSDYAIKYFSRYYFYISKIPDAIIILLLAYVFYFFVPKELEFSQVLAVVTVTVYIGYIISIIISRIFTQPIRRKFMEIPVFEITKGDKNLSAKIKKDYLRLIVKYVLGLLAQWIISLILTRIIDFLLLK